MRCCAGDEGFVPLRSRPAEGAPSRLMLRWLKTVVVSDEEKAHWMRQAGTGKASASESLLTCRNPKTTSEPGCFGDSGMSLADIRLLARWCPACRRREPGLRLPHGTGEGASRCWPVLSGPSGREVPKRLNREGLSTVAGRAGGPARSSWEAPVTGVERRGRVVRGLIRLINRKCSGRNHVDKLKAPGKPFEISKQAVWEAWEKVKADKGAPGVDAVTIEEFGSDLKNNLCKIWNRLSSGTWFPLAT